MGNTGRKSHRPREEIHSLFTDTQTMTPTQSVESLKSSVAGTAVSEDIDTVAAVPSDTVAAVPSLMLFCPLDTLDTHSTAVSETRLKRTARQLPFTAI